MRKLKSLNEEHLAWAFGLPFERLEEIANDPLRHYHTFPDRRNGKLRTITAPSRELKKALRRFHRQLLLTLPIHDSAACASGKGVLWAARRHRTPPFLLQLDIADFFPSVTPERVAGVLSWHGCPNKTLELLTGLLTLRGELPQGSPTSVTIANLVLYRLDVRISRGIDAGLSYTRYIDDLSLSGGRRVATLYAERIKQWMTEDGWKVHPNKGGCFGPGERQKMLGVMVNAQVTACPRYVKDLRTVLRSLVRRDWDCSAAQLESLRGKVLWLQQIHPETNLGRLFSDAEAAFHRHGKAATFGRLCDA